MEPRHGAWVEFFLSRKEVPAERSPGLCIFPFSLASDSIVRLIWFFLLPNHTFQNMSKTMTYFKMSKETMKWWHFVCAIRRAWHLWDPLVLQLFFDFHHWQNTHLVTGSCRASRVSCPVWNDSLLKSQNLPSQLLLAVALCHPDTSSCRLKVAVDASSASGLQRTCY